MSINHAANMATHAPQSLPSFAQAFSAPSLNSISTNNNALPPIQNRLPPMDPARPRQAAGSPPTQVQSRPGSAENGAQRRSSMKRPHPEDRSGKDDKHGDSSDSDKRRSPRLVRIKEEQEHEALDPSMPSPVPTRGEESMTAPPPSSLRPQNPHPTKRRRVTISGVTTHPLNTNVQTPSSERTTPISPVVMGFTLNRDDPAALEQVRSMLTVKQKQKALIEQRRGSVPGIVSAGNPLNPPSVNVVNPREDRDRRPSPAGKSVVVAPNRRSPATVGGRPRRSSTAAAMTTAPNPTASSSLSVRQPSPSPHIVPSQLSVAQNHHHHPHAHAPGPSDPSSSSSASAYGHASAAANALPPPPISFARRRAGMKRKDKPADILISPRELEGGGSHMQPLVQSAPPVPGQQPGKFPMMALPSLPPVLGPGGQNVRRAVGGHVPPTPTRLGMPRNTGGGGPPARGGGGGRSSPPGPSVPIASTLVPPTPASLHHPSYTSEKSAFLAPFETFYDALADSKQLKTWLGEQLQRSQGLVREMQMQQGRVEEMVEAVVERRMAGVVEEIYGLRRRVGELEEALAGARGEVPPGLRGMGAGMQPHPHARARARTISVREGMGPSPSLSLYAPPPSSHPDPAQYTFPPAPVRRPSSSGGDLNEAGSERASPISFDVGKRAAVSAMRYEAHPSAVEVGRPGSGSGQHSRTQSSGGQQQQVRLSPAYRHATVGGAKGGPSEQGVSRSPALGAKSVQQQPGSARAGGFVQPQPQTQTDQERESTRPSPPTNSESRSSPSTRTANADEGRRPSSSITNHAHARSPSPRNGD